MDRLVSIPKRVSEIKARKELTAISPDVFISIPKRVSEVQYSTLLIGRYYTLVEYVRANFLSNMSVVKMLLEDFKKVLTSAIVLCLVIARFK